MNTFAIALILQTLHQLTDCQLLFVPAIEDPEVLSEPYGPLKLMFAVAAQKLAVIVVAPEIVLGALVIVDFRDWIVFVAVLTAATPTPAIPTESKIIT
jgi:hypothetical protein